jgi:actin related protein 2/3 complex subunit 1A/1B
MYVSIRYRVTDIDWHPNSQLLVTGSTDLKCRVFSAYISEIDGPKENPGPFHALAPFGEVMAEFEHANAWVNSVAWSPQGDRLAFAGHGSSIHFVHFFTNNQPTIQSIRFSQLPLNKILFLSNDVLIGAGHDFNILLFSIEKEKDGYWAFSDVLDKKKMHVGASGGGATATGGFNAARSMWESKVSRGQSADATQEDKGALWT